MSSTLADAGAIFYRPFGAVGSFAVTITSMINRVFATRILHLVAREKRRVSVVVDYCPAAAAVDCCSG